jgi:hypothetical protein
MSARDGRRFLPALDGVSLCDGDDALAGVLEIGPKVPAAVLVGIAHARLSRQVELLDELTTMPLGVTVQLEPFASALCASLQEIQNLLAAAGDRMRAPPKGGGT